MPSIYYEKRDGEVYKIDEVSQRLLVYVYLHGGVRPKDVADPIGVDNEHSVHSLVQSQLGGSAADFLDTEQDPQQTLGNDPDNVRLSLVLTKAGQGFVEKHRADLSMPVEIAELAKRVAALQIEDHIIDDLLHRVNTLEQRIEDLEDSPVTYDTLHATQPVLKEFYEEMRDLRKNLVKKVSGIPDDRGDAKKRYSQVILDRMIFLYFIQENRLLDRNLDYLSEQPNMVVDDGEDKYANFYQPLFFKYLAEDKQNPEFGSLPYLNSGLFVKNPVEEDFPNAKLGESAEETNELFDDILDFLSGWDWNVDGQIDIVDPENLSPTILSHLLEQTVNQN